MTKVAKVLKPLWPWMTLFISTFCLAASLGRAAEPAIKSSSPGKKLYQARCAKCHRMYDPGKYTDAQWQSWMGKMSKKAKLRPEEKQALLDYVEQTLRDPAKKEDRNNGARVSTVSSK